MSDNQWWFFDLAAVIAVTGGLTFGLFSGVSGVPRVILVIPLILFLPGYAFVSALFPDKPTDEYQPFDEEKTGLGNPLLVTGGLKAIERTILSFVFSVAFVPAVALLTSVTPRGLTAEMVFLGLALLTVVLSIIAIGSRYRCPSDRRFVPSLSSVPLLYTSTQSNAYTTTNVRPYNLAIGVGLVLLLASAGFAIVNPPEHDGFTEISVETENVTGDIDTMYESTYTTNETHELDVTITNQEHEDRTYMIVTLMERVDVEDGNTTVTETDELERHSVTVADGETHEQPLEITPSMQGEGLRLTILLYEGDAPSEPSTDNAYEAIHLPIEVE